MAKNQEKVKQIWNIISVFVITLLAVPTGVFAAPQSFLYDSAGAGIPMAQVVKVVRVQTRQKVAFRQAAAVQSASCLFQNSAAANLVQSGGTVNLNQPASCFTLIPAKASAQSELAVAVIKPLETIVLPSQNRISQLPVFAPGQTTQNAALPVLIFIVSAAVLTEQKKGILKFANKRSVNIARALTIHQLGVLRC